MESNYRLIFRESVVARVVSLSRKIARDRAPSESFQEYRGRRRLCPTTILYNVQIAIEAVLKRNQLGLAQCSRDYLGTAIGEKARLSRTFSNRFGSVRLLHLFSRSPRPEIDRASPSPLPRNVKAKKCRGGWRSARARERASQRFARLDFGKSPRDFRAAPSSRNAHFIT